MDLKVVGAGRLGCRVAYLWKKKFPESKIYLKTRSNDANRSAKWKSLGFIPLSFEDDKNHIQAKFVLFSAPPSDNSSYTDDVQAAVLKDWISSDGGKFVFTGSGSVYSENSGHTVHETSNVSRDKERQIVLLNTEDVVLKNGGLVLRFGGLYEMASRLINYWLSKEEKREINSCPNGLINMIHYDDAARCIIKALLTSFESNNQLFLVSDGVPMSRQSICEAALKCPLYHSKILPTFLGDPSCIDGKQYQTSLVCNKLGWTPMFRSFAEFMEKSYDQELDMSSIV